MMDNLQQAFELLETNEFEKAIEIIDRTWPKLDEDMQIAIANLYKQYAFLENANQILESLLENNKDDIDLRLELIENYIELGNDEKVLSLLENLPKIKSSDPQYLRIVIQEGDIYQALGLPEVALQKLQTAKRKLPNEPYLDLALGELLFSLGRYQNALIYYENLKELDKDLLNFSIDERMAEAYAATGQYEKALQKFHEIDSNELNFLFNYALTALQASEYQLAKRLFLQLIEKDKNVQFAYIHLSKIYRKMEKYEKAYEISLKGLKIDEFNKELFLELAKSSHSLKKIEKAKKYLYEAIALDPEYSEPVFLLIDILEEEENYEEIIELLQTLKEDTNLNDPSYDWELAKSFNQIEDYKKSLKYYQKSYDLLKDNSGFLKDYGYFLIEDGQFNKGIEILKKSLQIDPTDEELNEYIERMEHSY